MAQIEMLLEKQLLSIRNQEIISSGDMDYDTCSFTFDASWDGFTKTGVFYQDKKDVQYAVLGADGSCTIPARAMAREGNMYIGVFGVSGSRVMTSTVERVYIRQGAISGDTVSTEPSDDVFLAIIAQYQRIIELMRQYEETAAAFNDRMEEQNGILGALNAFDVAEVMQRLDLIEDRMISYVNMAKEIMEREFIIRDVPIRFIEKTCRVEDDRITDGSLCEVFFDEYSYEIAARALILPVSHNGYIEVASSLDIGEELNANILVRRG